MNACFDSKPNKKKLNILLRRHPELRLKALGEVRVIRKTNHIHHLGNRELLLLQQHGGFLHTNGFDIFHRRHAGELFYLAIHLLVIRTRPFTEGIHIQFRVRNVFLNQMDNACQELLKPLRFPLGWQGLRYGLSSHASPRQPTTVARAKAEYPVRKAWQ